MGSFIFWEPQSGLPPSPTEGVLLMWEQTTGGLQPCPFIKVPLLLLATWTCPHPLRPLLSPYQTWGSVGLKCPSLGNEARTLGTEVFLDCSRSSRRQRPVQDPVLMASLLKWAVWPPWCRLCMCVFPPLFCEALCPPAMVGQSRACGADACGAAQPVASCSAPHLWRRPIRAGASAQPQLVPPDPL